MVVSSSKVSLALAMMCVKCVFVLLTAASHRPLKCDALSRMKTRGGSRISEGVVLFIN